MPSAALDRLGRALRSPLGQAVLVYGVFLAVSLLARGAAPESPLLVGAAALTFYSVASPLALVFLPRFFLGLVLGVVSWVVLFVAMGATCQGLMPPRALEGAMVFLLPMMVYPVALLAAGIARLAFRRRLGPPRARVAQ